MIFKKCLFDVRIMCCWTGNCFYLFNSVHLFIKMLFDLSKLNIKSFS